MRLVLAFSLLCTLPVAGCSNPPSSARGGADLEDVATTDDGGSLTGSDAGGRDAAGSLTTDAAPTPGDAAGSQDMATTPDAAPPSTATLDGFPHIATLGIGGTQSYDASFQAHAARFHINIIGGNWEGWEKQFGYSKESAIHSVKMQSKIGSRVFQYVNLNEQPMTGSWFPTYLAKVQAMNWWTYVVGTSGTKASSSYNPTWGVINMTAASPADPMTGLHPYEFGAKYVNDFFHLGQYTGTSAAPSLDGFFLDNVMTQPRENGDWSRSGSTQSDTNAAVDLAFRTGEKTFFTEMVKQWPTATTFGNFASTPGVDVTPLQGAMSGALIEGAIGYSWSDETWSGAALMQQNYKYAWDQLGGGKYALFGHSDVQANGSDATAWDSNGKATAYGPAWKGMRYGITACLMGDGYYTATLSESYASEATLWFDEFDGGGLGVGYLGQAKDAFQTAAWSNGVWKREYDHGVVLWNPKGNGSKTVSLAGLGNLKRLHGTQDATTNSGATVTGGSITLADRDGIILLRY